MMMYDVPAQRQRLTIAVGDESNFRFQKFSLISTTAPRPIGRQWQGRYGKNRCNTKPTEKAGRDHLAGTRQAGPARSG